MAQLKDLIVNGMSRFIGNLTANKITLPSSLSNKMLKTNADGEIVAATSGTDYQAPLEAGTDYQTPLPSQSGKNGKYLKTNGTTMSWEDAPTPPVSSVNSKTGAVQLNASDVGAVPTSAISGTATHLAKFNGANTLVDGPAIGTDTTKFLNNKGEWAVPEGTYTLPTLYWADQEVSNSSSATTTPTFKASRIRNTWYGLATGSTSNTPVETVLYTGIPFTNNKMIVIHLTGYAYGKQSPVEFKVGFYVYNNSGNMTFVAHGATNMGSWKPTIYLFTYTRPDNIKYVALGLAGECYYLQLQADVQVETIGNFTNINVDPDVWSFSFAQSSDPAIIPAENTNDRKTVSYKADILNPYSVSTTDAHKVLIGPSSGSAAPTFRALTTTDIPDLSETYAVTDHVHGNITSGGDITATAPTIANGDQLIINDNSASKITNGPTFDGSTTTQYLSKKGTWESVPVTSVNGQTGAVTISVPVTSVNNQTGDVVIDLSPYLKKDGSVAMTGALNMDSHKITSVTDPTADQDAATKKYVDSKVSGLGSVLNYKGVRQSSDELPLTGNVQGDVWIVATDNSEYVWTLAEGSGTIAGWEKLGPLINLSGYKTKQTAVSDPETGLVSATAFISGISQNANGEISVTKSPVDFSTVTTAINNAKVVKSSTSMAAADTTKTITLNGALSIISINVIDSSTGEYVLCDIHRVAIVSSGNTTGHTITVGTANHANALTIEVFYLTY